MQIDNMLNESIQLLVLGMGSVFFILLLLIVCLSVMSQLLSAPVEATDATEHTNPQTATADATTAVGVVAAIQAAIHFYRAAPNR